MKKGRGAATLKKKKKGQAIAYRIKCKRTANGLSHYVPSDKKALV